MLDRAEASHLACGAESRGHARTAASNNKSDSLDMPAPDIAQGSDALDHEFSFSKADFDRVRELIYKHAGISLHDGKHAMVYSRLSRRLRETGHRSFASYLQWLEASSGPAGAQEWQEFVNCLTTNLTSFFREEHHFHALKDDLKPFVGKPVRIW